MRDLINTTCKCIFLLLILVITRNLGLGANLMPAQMFNLGVLMSIVVLIFLGELTKIIHMLVITGRLLFCSEEIMAQILKDLGYKIDLNSKTEDGTDEKI